MPSIPASPAPAADSVVPSKVVTGGKTVNVPAILPNETDTTSKWITL